MAVLPSVASLARAVATADAACAVGLTDCNGVCKNLARDEANCGTCGRACPAGFI